MPRTVLITGSSRGIGAACAEEFARLGYRVIINYHSHKEAALALKERLSVYTKTDIAAIRADVSDEKDVECLFAEAEERYGGIDILVNNAGISQIGLLNDVSSAEWDRIFAVNVRSAFLCAKRAIPHMLHEKWGRIINLSSMWGICGASCEVSYSASKAAIIGFTKSLAKELAPSGITVNAIAPGLIHTDMNIMLSAQDLADFVKDIPISREGLPAEVAQAAVFFAGENTGYITSQILAVDGGMT